MFGLRWCSFAVKYIRLASVSFISFVFFCHRSSDFLFNKFFIRRLTIHFLLLAFYTRWEEGIGGLITVIRDFSHQ